MGNKIFKILAVTLVLFCLIGAVSASESMTETQLMDENNLGDLNDDSLSVSDSEVVDDFDKDDSLSFNDCELIGDDEKHTDIYVNSSKEIDGDGLSPETAYKSWDNDKLSNLDDNATVHLAEGEYGIPGNCHKSVSYIGSGEKTIITSFAFKESYYFNTNHTVTVINATFRPYLDQIGVLQYGLNHELINYNVLLDEMNFKFINCTFINSTFLTRTYERTTPNRDTLTDIICADFENCTFKDYSGNYLINNWECSKFVINKCVFENITADAIVDSYGGKSDSYGRIDGIYIYNSTFANCDINGVVKARQFSSCVISNCTYDFPVSADIPLVGPFYINSTDRSVIKTNLDVLATGNTLIITLTDESNKPMVDYEVEIVTNGRVSYEYTDSSGKIILNNLLGNYSFEISYPGDEYVGYAPCKVFKNFTFVKSKLATVLVAPQVSAAYNVAKNLVITLKDSNGKALANKKVTVKVGSISKTLTTNSKGQVSLNVATLVPKTYTATISFKEDVDYKGSSLSSKVTVSKGATKLVAKAKTFKVKAKAKKLSVTLKDSKNRVLKGKKLTIKVNGKTYSATTNKKGGAVFKITKLSRKGTFKSKIAFKGDKWYKAISKTVKIKVK